MGRLVFFCFLVAQIFILRALALASAFQASGPNPFELKNHTEVELNHEETARAADRPVSEDTYLSEKHRESESEAAAEAPEIRKLGKHHSTDKSMAGGGVIIAGLVTAIFGVVVCYIRVTRKKSTAH